MCVSEVCARKGMGKNEGMERRREGIERRRSLVQARLTIP